VHVAKLAIKWGAKLIGYQRVINKALLIERLLIACAVASHTPTTFRVAGFDRKCLPPTGSLHDEVVTNNTLVAQILLGICSAVSPG
jgi:hypothetical protein